LIRCAYQWWEEYIIAGARETIARFGPTIVGKVDNVATAVLLFNQLKDLSYDVWLTESPVYNPRNVNGSANNIFGHAAVISLIAVHRDRARLAQLLEFGHKVRSPDELAARIVQCP